eukprot:tig00020554_g10789.t1
MYLIQLIEREFELKQPQQIMLFEGRRLWIELGSIKCISDFGIGPGATIRVLKGSPPTSPPRSCAAGHGPRRSLGRYGYEL